MTDPNNTHEHDTPHEGPVKTPKQLIAAVFFAFVIPIIGIILLASFVTSGDKPGAGSDGLEAAAVAQRIAPVGKIEVKDPTDVAAMKPGNVVFESQCIACHGTGAAGAPKFGDASAWAPRLASGFQALWNSALHGKGAMPPQSGGDFSDLEVGRAVVYMTSKVGGTFTEPTLDDANKMSAMPATAAAPAAGGDAAAVAAAANAASAIAAANTTAPTAAGGAPAAVPALYTQACQACHAAGIAGSPKFGDKAAWGPRLALGIDGLTAAAIKGIGAMPPRGGTTASDDEIKAVVTYMVNAVK
ncbi:MAG: cytochrome c5 family protein [Rhizobacter sp.]|nr:cytochrome c5 family protein [Rhizobacter sp.]